MAGSYIAHKLFSPSSAPETNAAIDKEFGQCSTPFKSFLECVENNPDNIGSCQWTYNTFYNCQNGILLFLLNNYKSFFNILFLNRKTIKE